MERQKEKVKRTSFWISPCFVVITSIKKNGAVCCNKPSWKWSIMGFQFTKLCHWFRKIEQPVHQQIRCRPKPAVNWVRDFPSLAAGCTDLPQALIGSLQLYLRLAWCDFFGFGFSMKSRINIVIVTELSGQVTVQWTGKLYGRRDFRFSTTKESAVLLVALFF